MRQPAFTLVPVETPSHREAARRLVSEYLQWVAAVAKSEYGLEFDIDAMVTSDIQDAAKFYPPDGRFYLVKSASGFSGVGALKRLSPGVGEIQRMYVRQHLRGAGAGRALVNRLLDDAVALGYRTVRLESLRALQAAHALYHSVGFVDIDPYADNSMSAYQQPAGLRGYRRSAVFMEWSAARAR